MARSSSSRPAELQRQIKVGYLLACLGVMIAAWTPLAFFGVLPDAVATSHPNALAAAAGGYAVSLAIASLIHWMRYGGRNEPTDPLFLGYPLSALAVRAGARPLEYLAIAALLFSALLLPPLWTGPLAVSLAVLVGSMLLSPPERMVQVPRLLLDDTQPVERGTVARQWSWTSNANGQTSSVSLWIRAEAAISRRDANQTRGGIVTSAWGPTAEELVLQGSKDAEVQEAARQLLSWAREHRLVYFDEARNTLQFVQTIPYKSDLESARSQEYWRYPIETLHDDAGDCDCKAILAAALFRAMGLRSVVMLSEEEGHAAVAVEGAPDYPDHTYFVYDGRRYFFCETTDGTHGFEVGAIPCAPGQESEYLKRYQVRVPIEPKLAAATAG